MRQVKFLWLVLVAAFLVACQTPPQAGPNYRLTQAYSTISEARAQTTILLNADKISSKDGANIQAQLRTAQDGVDVAGPLLKQDLTSGEAKLAAVEGVLASIRTYLIKKGATFHGS